MEQWNASAKTRNHLIKTKYLKLKILIMVKNTKPKFVHTTITKWWYQICSKRVFLSLLYLSTTSWKILSLWWLNGLEKILQVNSCAALQILFLQPSFSTQEFWFCLWMLIFLNTGLILLQSLLTGLIMIIHPTGTQMLVPWLFKLW